MTYCLRSLITPLLFTVSIITATTVHAGTWTTIDFPGQSQTLLQGVNNNGDMSGYYIDASQVAHGFLVKAGTFTEMDVPGAIATYTFNLNDADQFAGYYISSSDGVYRGFFYDGQSFTTLEYPGSTFTYAYGLNNFGVVVGAWEDSRGLIHGFSWSNGAFTSFDYSGGVGTHATGINDGGLIVGYYLNADNTLGSFGRDALGNIRTLVVHGGVVFGAVNNHNTTVGQANWPYFDGFRDNLPQHAYFLLQFPQASYTLATGINDSGTIVGYYNGPSTTHGFMFTN